MTINDMEVSGSNSILKLERGKGLWDKVQDIFLEKFLCL